MDKQLEGEIQKIVTSFKTFLASGKNAIDDSLVARLDNPGEIENLHAYLREAEKAGSQGCSLNVLAVSDLTDIMAILHGPQSLQVEDFLILRTFTAALNDARERFNLGAEYPLLTDLALDIQKTTLLDRSLEATFSQEGEILDTASNQLAQIRRELRAVSAQCASAINRLRDRYRTHLALPDPAIRNGRETLAVKTGEKGFVPGIVIDRSKTGETLFVLPYELLELENKREKLIGEEQAEIDRILMRLTNLFREHLPELERDYYAYNMLDAILARVNFGHSYDGCIASLDAQTLHLRDFIHPLIELERAVPNSLGLGSSAPRVLIISGPNAGGKSVMLKAVALAAVMNQMGLMVPAREATLPCFDHVFVLTGDSESLAGNLSSFSGHLKGLKEMYEQATPRSLILVDEIGQGTAPEDGEAIGYAFIQHVLALRAFACFTTHYDGLKKMAAERDDILSGAMEFSQKDLKPTFRFLSGAVGHSYAFEVAAQSGIALALIDAAKAYKASLGKLDLEKLEQELTAKIQHSNELEHRLNERLAEANRLIAKRENAIKALDEQRENIRRKADAKVNDAAKRRIEDLDRLWKAGQTKDLPFNERARIKGELRKAGGLEAEETTAGTASAELKPGDIVVYQGMTGTLESVSKNRARFTANGMTFTVDPSQLRRSDASRISIPRRSGSSIDRILTDRAAHTTTRLNIIGMTVAEAIPVVDKFLSDAVMAHLSQVTIVHGMGTFALRNGIWDHLRRVKIVKSFHEAGESQGAMGATVVDLR